MNFSYFQHLVSFLELSNFVSKQCLVLEILLTEVQVLDFGLMVQLTVFKGSIYPLFDHQMSSLDLSNKEAIKHAFYLELMAF